MCGCALKNQTLCKCCHSFHVILFTNISFFDLCCCDLGEHLQYTATLRPLIILQKRAVRLTTFSEFRAHSDPIFHDLGLLKLPDIIFLHNALFMYDFYSDSLPSVFNCFFLPVNRITSIQY